MSTSPNAIDPPGSKPDSNETAVERAIAHGVDISLLKKNLQMTPSARVLQAQAALDSVIALQSEVKRWREKQKLRA